MQKDAAQTLYSASDLCHFAECQYLTVLDAQHLLTPMVKTPDAQEAEQCGVSQASNEAL